MRWTIWLVAFCLAAASAARPAPPGPPDSHEAGLGDASDLCSTLAPRRPSAISHDQRVDRRLDLHPFAVAAVVPAPDRQLLASSSVRASVGRSHARVAASSRGPPVAWLGGVESLSA